MVVSFQAHQLLFSFDYRSLEYHGHGVIDFAYFFQAEGFSCFLYVSHFVSSFLSRLNTTNLICALSTNLAVGWRFFQGSLFCFGVYFFCCHLRQYYQELDFAIMMKYVLATLVSIKPSMGVVGI